MVTDNLFVTMTETTFTAEPVQVRETQEKLCKKLLLPVQDVLELTSGKWRLHIIMALTCVGEMRFNELRQALSGVSGKVLSAELKELEAHDILKRTVYDTYPVTIKYELTPYGKTLENVVNALRDWGLKHRKHIHQS